MSARISDLLQEMQGIFGGSFGGEAGPLNESAELNEGPGLRQGKTRRQAPSDKGLLRGKKGGFAPKSRGGREFDRRSAKKISKLAQAAIAKDPSHKDKEQADKEKFKDAMRKAVGGSKGAENKKAGSTGVGKKQSAKGGGAAASSGASSGSEHHPFKRNSNLGTGPGTPPGFSGTGPRHHDQTRCWKCNCSGGVYSSGCNCVASGSGENCPEKGTTKKISYKPKYKRAYNDMYHAWRASKGGAITKRIGGR